MTNEIEQLLMQFDREFRNNSSYRIEELLNDSRAINLGQKDLLVRELILLETDVRYAAGQEMGLHEYLDRFPDFSEEVKLAFRRIENLAAENSEFELLDVTRDLREGNSTFVVSQFGPTNIPNDLGRFKDITFVGKGGFGVVCKGYDSVVGEFRALKFPAKSDHRNQEFITEVYRETQQSKDLIHPNIVRTYGMEIINPYAIIVQQFIDGENLKQWMARENPLKSKVEMVAKIAAGLQYAHENDITHRDIKPLNILVDRNSTPYIADFGLAFHEKDQLGLPSWIEGTLQYLAPEIAAGYVRQCDGRADIFSLGVILYEMLTSRKPFRGSDERELLHEIQTKPPRPIRIINPDVDAELERICFRCLEKKTGDRYLTAGDVEAELNYWMSETVQNETVVEDVEEDQYAVFVPKGLRSYNSEDSGFFLELLPGVRDRGNIPASINFWIKRICEPVPEDLRVPHAFVFGPSGSGKSSFMKAGLLPMISDRVEAIYVESTRDDTEVRIMKSLRRRFPKIDDSLSLPEMFAGLVNRNWIDGNQNQKVLLVIDQFEQRISREDLFEDSQLVRALKHCDGENLQCVMLVRDDFVFACNRFADTLDLNLRESENYQNIHLFENGHAKKVLNKLGQAFGRLPETDSISEDQHTFLEQTIEQLSQNQQVICVRLTLFAEMFKSRPWTVQELKSVGGVTGVGEQFLESTFGEDSLQTRYRAHRTRVQSILEELLPESGSNIRGTMKTSDDLMVAAHCENNPRHFADCIQILHDELRIITRTDPDASGETSVNEEISATEKVYYQLTHDYLVPSIRDWLLTKQNETAAGRIRARFSSLAKRWNDEHDKLFLPTFVEFAQVLRHCSFRRMSENERSLWKQSRRYYAIRCGFASSIVALLIVTYSLILHSQNKSMAREYVDRFMTGHPAATLSNALLMERYSGISKSLLMQELDAAVDPDQKSRVAIGLALLGSREPIVVQYLIESIDSQFDGRSINIITALDAIPDAHEQLIEAYEETKEQTELPILERRARIAITLFFLGQAKWVAEQLESEQVEFKTCFIGAIRSWQGEPTQINSFLPEDVSENANAVLCLAIGQFLESKLAQISPESATQLIEHVGRIYEDCQSSYLTSASDWLLRKLGVQAEKRSQDRLLSADAFNSADTKTIWVDSLGLRMHRIEPREVLIERRMGDQTTEFRFDLENPFYAADREITIADFKKFLADENYKFDKASNIAFQGSENMPITKISYIDAVMFCNWLSRTHHLKECYAKSPNNYKLGPEKNSPNFMKSIEVPLNEWTIDETAGGFRLPTFAEWQCLEKPSDDLYFDFGPKTVQKYMTNYGWFESNSTDEAGKPQPQLPRQKIPNQNGLFDVYGNTDEYCWDFPFQNKEAQALMGLVIAARGGKFRDDPLRMTKTQLSPEFPYSRPKYTGFRIVISASN